MKNKNNKKGFLKISLEAIYAVYQAAQWWSSVLTGEIKVAEQEHLASLNPGTLLGLRKLPLIVDDLGGTIVAWTEHGFRAEFRVTDCRVRGVEVFDLFGVQVFTWDTEVV